ncbi:MAG: ribosome-associated translation inhibitor RaiA [Patescibacteria group bacterium]
MVDMKIIIKATDLDLTPALKAYIEEKFNDLDRPLGSLQKDSIKARVEVGRSTRHHKHGDVFHVDANLDLPHEVLRAEEDTDDAYAAIDAVKDKLKREIEKYKEKHI